MEKNVYQILQDWHDLLKSDAITEAEFAAKKRELLEIVEKKQKHIQTPELIHILTPEEQAQRDAEYDMLFNSKNWFQRNKTWILVLSIVLLSGITIWYFAGNQSKASNNFDNSTIESISSDTSYYIVNADENNLVHFYKSADITTQKASYFNSKDTVYVQTIENGFGYVEFTNGRGQTSKGWLKMGDLQSCPNCGTNK